MKVRWPAGTTLWERNGVQSVYAVKPDWAGRWAMARTRENWIGTRESLSGSAEPALIRRSSAQPVGGLLPSVVEDDLVRFHVPVKSTCECPDLQGTPLRPAFTATRDISIKSVQIGARARMVPDE